MAKIAVEWRQALDRRRQTGSPGSAEARRIAFGEGWSVDDVLCTSGPEDRPFEERHSWVSIAIVALGCFQYRSALGRELMTPGSILLGNPGQAFECGHEHAAGDRCLSFRFDPNYFASLASDLQAEGRFDAMRLPPLRQLSPLVTEALALMAGSADGAWEELGIRIAAQALRTANDLPSADAAAPLNAVARITEAVRLIEEQPEAPLQLADLAIASGLSRFHFLRTFERVTGLTPHQFVLRTRLRQAAFRVLDEPSNILEIALSSGFNDLSNFNRAFRAEFGCSPRRFRQSIRRLPQSPSAVYSGKRPLRARTAH